MVVRAFEYLPVVDVTFGDVVRGIVTSDRALYPDDALHLRTNLVEALRRRGIYPPAVSSLAEASLRLADPAGAAQPDRPATTTVDLAPLIEDATRNLDTYGGGVDDGHECAGRRPRGHGDGCGRATGTAVGRAQLLHGGRPDRVGQGARPRTGPRPRPETRTRRGARGLRAGIRPAAAPDRRRTVRPASRRARRPDASARQDGSPSAREPP